MRSRKALLRRRADSEKKGTTSRKKLYYKVSLSLLLLSWGLVFLLNPWTGYGNGYRDELGSETYYSHETHPLQDEVSSSENTLSLSDDVSSSENTLSLSDDVSSSENTLSLSDTIFDQNVPKTAILIGETVGQEEEVLVEGNKASPSNSVKEQADGETIKSDTKVEKESLLKSDRLIRVAPPGLDEFKSKAITMKGKHISSETATVVPRVEPGGKEYNYASASKGAKVLEYNKEAKGASNILDKDKDKYLRNPCSAEGKYVVIELSEETLVNTIEIANFEHYSSNLKDFELLSSLAYPADSWVKLGNFTAPNAKHAQRFTLPEPKWARYLKLNLLSHYGSEFYCTLSVVEVFGVDAVERMLENLISVENKRLETDEQQNTEQMPLQEPSSESDLYQEELLTEIDNNESSHEGGSKTKDIAKKTTPEPVLETRQVGRMPGDAVLKILLQKVESLDINFSVLERYLKELNSRYAHIFKDFDDDIENKDTLLDKIKLQIKILENNKDMFEKDIGELLLWKSLISLQLDKLARDNAMLRSDFGRVQEHEVAMENRGLVVIFISFIIVCFASTKLFIGFLLSMIRTGLSVNFCRTESAWLFLLLTSSVTALVLVL